MPIPTIQFAARLSRSTFGFRLLRSTPFLLLALVGGTACRNGGLQLGTPVPPVTLVRWDGSAIDGRELAVPFILVFFDDHCVACRRFLDEFLQLHLPDRYRTRILFLSKAAPALPLPDLLKLHSQLYILEPAAWEKHFGIRTTPTLLFFDRERKLSRIQVGTRSAAQLERRFNLFLGDR